MKRKRASSRAADDFQLPGWDRLRHGGLLFDAARAAELAKFVPKEPLTGLVESRFRRLADALGESRDPAAASRFVNYTLDEVCGFARSGSWTRGNEVPAEEGRRALTGELAKPRSRWTGRNGARLPVFFDRGQRLGVGKGRREMSRVVEWLRNGGEHLALLTNGREWRLVFAGLDYEAWCEWTVESFFEEGGLAPQVETLRTLLSPPPWTPETEGKDAPLLRAIRDTRKGQAAVSEELGERVREAVEILIRSHGEPLKRIAGETDPADIYRAACRVAMRMVVVLYAESRDLLPRDNALYDAAYGLTALRDRLQRHEAAGRPLSDRTAAWPRLLALFRLVHDGCSHSELPVTRYGGELFAPGAPDAAEGVSRALSVFETACFDSETASDQQVNTMLRLLTRTRIRVPKGRTSAVVAAPVDFSDLSSEYIGVLYEGLLDYELKTAAEDDPVVFLPVGDRPALPLSRLEEMEEKALKALFEKLKKPSSAGDDAEPEEATAEDAAKEDEPEVAGDADETPDDEASPADEGAEYRERARRWALRAVEAAKLVKKPRGRMTPERRLTREREIASAAERLVARLVPPGEWYLVRWGGTRKGSGSFYTRPGLAIPTVQRTLRPLAFDPPTGEDGEPDRFAPGPKWSPKKPEDILQITVCDPACGSGTFPLAALRFLTDALYDSLRFHGRIEPQGEASLVRLLGLSDGASDRATEELIPAPPDADDFEPRLKAVLRRYVVERCIYAVDLDPLAVELCRLSLWIETMDRELPFGFLDHKIKCGNALIGAWFDQFRHYPVMAWKNRMAGDENHTNGVHFKRNTRGKAIRAFVRERLSPDLCGFLGGRTLFDESDQLEKAANAHDEAQATLQLLHSLPVRDPAALAARYRREFVGSSAWQSLKDAMDLWCACWFWPPEELHSAPLPTDLAEPALGTRRTARRVAAEMRFFHWELEFPDVFREEGSGFSAVLGNPPWEVAKPISMEFFSDHDPLYRSYGKQEALKKQKDYFEDEDIEARWLDYRSRFRAQSNFTSHAARPFGEPEAAEKSSQRFTIARGDLGLELHQRWRDMREKALVYCDEEHPFRHQGSADLNLYKLFLEAAHNLLRPRGRLGFLVPSGLYSDHGTRELRHLFLERCRWEWLFSIENRKKIFPIHRSYKFNPVIVEKGLSTGAIRTAFMRHDIGDWERAEQHTIPYGGDRVRRFSPGSRAFFEIQSPRDLEILGKIYENAVLLGDDGPDGWGIRYYREFDMTGDSELFPPRPEWEAKGYRPDEYNRWLLGDWRPMEELWEELGVDPTRPEAVTTDLEAWLVDAETVPVRRAADAHLAGRHLLRPGDVARTDWRLRCARRPYDTLPISRAGLPHGVILSRSGDAWIREADVRDVAFPFYQGIMIQPFVPAARGWLSGTGLKAKWDYADPDHPVWNPQYLMGIEDLAVDGLTARHKIGFRDVSRDTDGRSFQGAVLPDFPAGHSAPVLTIESNSVPSGAPILSWLLGILNCFVFDWQTRQRGGAAHLTWGMLKEMALPATATVAGRLASLVMKLGLSSPVYAPLLVRTRTFEQAEVSGEFALLDAEQYRLRAIIDAVAATLYELDLSDMVHVLSEVDHPADRIEKIKGALDACGFWRVDRERDPELRHTVLTLVALKDLREKIAAAGGDREEGIAAFLFQNDGEGWMLPETVRLADYGLGHDDRAKERQPVASRFGPRFYDWQLAQSPEEREQETHLHARNVLGAERYGELLATTIADDASDEDDFTPLLDGVSTNLDDDYRRRLLGEPGVAALIAQLCVWNGRRRKSWRRLLTTLTSAGLLDDPGRVRVLDRLLKRKLITAELHEQLTASRFTLPERAVDLIAAEPKHEFELRSQRAPRKLFDD